MKVEKPEGSRGVIASSGVIKLLRSHMKMQNILLGLTIQKPSVAPIRYMAP